MPDSSAMAPARPTQAARTKRRVLLAAVAAALALRGGAARAGTDVVRVGYLRTTARRPTLSLLDQQAADDGLAGAKLAMDDNATTGRLMGQTFTLLDAPVPPGGDPVAALRSLQSQGAALLLSDLPADALLRLADATADGGITLFNIAAPDDALRGAQCRARIIHVAPSRFMLADAVAQYLVWKKWTHWLLAVGSHPEDELLAAAYRRAAKRFGARIVQERIFKDTGGARQTDSGVVQTQQQMPVFTQEAPDYDVLVAADENEVFAGDLPYRTWDARPVAGSAGLRPETWDAASDSWGGAQLQSRFTRLFHRRMSALDMQAWTAARMIGEAASRTHATDAATLVAYMRSPEFGVAAYKGQRLTVRDWDGQLRQPILLADGRSVVSISPQPGFLHPVTELDTLGADRPESQCVH